MLIGTLWPDRYTTYTAVPVPGGADPHAREREVLDLAEVIRIGPQFSAAEHDRARAASRLADLLADRGDLDELRDRADSGDRPAASRLADLLADRGDLDGLRARAAAGDEAAAEELPDLLIKQGRSEEAKQLRRFGLNPDGSIACA